VFADTFVPAELVALLVPLVAEAVALELVVEPPQAARPRARSVTAQAVGKRALMVGIRVSNRGRASYLRMPEDPVTML
jgi:hypothetical protein